VAVDLAAAAAGEPQAANELDGLACVERQAVAPDGRDRAPAPPWAVAGVGGLLGPAALAGLAADSVSVSAAANSAPRRRM
jgi:hypothetical protein